MSQRSTKEQREFARKQIVESSVPRDSLPYHTKFDELYREYKDQGFPELSKNDYWLLLLRTAKQGNARQLKSKKMPDTPSTTEENIEIQRLLPSIGERDRLPYTEAFEDIYEKFQKHTGRSLSKNDFWRILLRVSKSSRKPQPIDINPSNELSQSLIEELHSMNPWWRGNKMRKILPYRRIIFQSLFENVTRGRYHIVALRGPRQVGKTVLQEQMIDDLINKKRVVKPHQVLRVQFDDLTGLQIEDPILTIVRWFEKNVVKDTFNNMAARGLPVYIFLDEFQNVKNWSAQLKHLIDISECKFFVTGSSALRIVAGKESLAGRVQWNEINSLGLPEIAEFQGFDPLPPYQTEINLCQWKEKEFWINLKKGDWKDGNKVLILDEVFQIFCDFGGYPFCHRDKEVTWAEAEEYLFDTVVSKTIDLDLNAAFESETGKIRPVFNSTFLKNAFRIMCKYTGQDISIERLQRELVSACSKQLKNSQVLDILNFFERALLIRLVRPFEHRLKHSKEHVKICLCDHAIRTALVTEHVPLYGTNVNADLAGHIVEGIVGTYFRSIEQLNVSFFPQIGKGSDIEDEVDFILEIGLHHIPVEVKYKNKPDLGLGMQSFLNREVYNAPFGLVITKEEIPLDYFNDENIIPISLKKLLMLK